MTELRYIMSYMMSFNSVAAMEKTMLRITPQAIVLMCESEVLL